MTTSIEHQLVDRGRLASYLDAHLPGDGEVEVSRHMAGHSNETFFVKRGESQWVLRRPPLNVYLPTAHDVLREYRVMSALQSTAVRVPRTVLACEDESVIGAPFYLTERAKGAVIRDEVPPALDGASDRARIGSELIDALVELHSVDFASVGLEGLGKPSGYLERQIRRWTGQLELATSVTKSSREVPDMWKVRDWLSANVPDTFRTVIVHGDYKLDNVMYAEASPATLVAILDWEMSTLGDPLADLGWLLSFWREPDDPEDALRSGLPAVTSAPGFSSRRELIEQYASGSGVDPGDMRWYVVLAIWKLACLLEGSYGRHLMGTTDDPFFAMLEFGVPALAKGALDVAAGGLRL